MKTLFFSDAKRPILTFDAEDADFARDGDAFIIQAGGKISFQDSTLLEEVMHGTQACALTVTENGGELLHGRYFTTFLAVEEETLVVRVTVGE